MVHTSFVILLTRVKKLLTIIKYNNYNFKIKTCIPDNGFISIDYACVYDFDLLIYNIKYTYHATYNNQTVVETTISLS